MKILTKRTTKRKSNTPVVPFSTDERLNRMEAQIHALQLVIREMAGYTDAVSEDVDELLGEVFGDEGGDGTAAQG